MMHTNPGEPEEQTVDDWDRAVDYLVVGSGVAGLSAAITATCRGADTLVVESTDKWGGTTAISGGLLWLPNNSLMKDAGINDSEEAALQYMEQTIGNPGRWTSRERPLAFLQAIQPYLESLADEGVN